MKEIYRKWTIYVDVANTTMRFCYRWDRPLRVRQMYKKYFYMRRRPIRGARKFVESLQELGFKVVAISGTIDSEYCAKETRIWCGRFLGLRGENVLVHPKDEQKADVVPSLERSILVDDWSYYIDYWRGKGGLSILKDKDSNPKDIKSFRNFTDCLRKIKKIVELEECSKGVNRLIREQVS